jgi:small subunit ribosomal protein S16
MRLQRRGKKNYATYRVVVAERGAPVKGRSVADVGHYNPHTDVFSVAADKVAAWLKQGVQPSATVHNLLVEHGIIKAEKVTSWKPKKKPEDATKPAAPTPTPDQLAAT